MTKAARIMIYAFAIAMLSATCQATEPTASPNVILVLTDDLGYSDIGCYGATKVKTPNIDRLAETGIRLTGYYVSQPVCTASRASLMTGCYANRVGMNGALNPTSTTGIHQQELLLPEMLKSLGYGTAIFGKWHLEIIAENSDALGKGFSFPIYTLTPK